MAQEVAREKTAVPLLEWATMFGQKEIEQKEKGAAYDIFIKSFEKPEAFTVDKIPPTKIAKFFNTVGEFFVRLFTWSHSYELKFQINRFTENVVLLKAKDLENYQKEKIGALFQHVHEFNEYMTTQLHKLPQTQVQKVQDSRITTILKYNESFLKAKVTAALDNEILKEINTKSLTLNDDGSLNIGVESLQTVKARCLQNLGITDFALLEEYKIPLDEPTKAKLSESLKLVLEKAWKQNTPLYPLEKNIYNEIERNFSITKVEMFKNKFSTDCAEMYKKLVKEAVSHVEDVTLVERKGSLELVFGEKKTAIVQYRRELEKKVTGTDQQDPEVYAFIQESLPKLEYATIVYDYYQKNSIIEINKSPIFSKIISRFPFLEEEETTGLEDSDFKVEGEGDQKIDALRKKIAQLEEGHQKAFGKTMRFVLEQGVNLNQEEQWGIVDNIRSLYEKRYMQFREFNDNKWAMKVIECENQLKRMEADLELMESDVNKHDTIDTTTSSFYIAMLSKFAQTREKLENSKDEKIVTTIKEKSEISSKVFGERCADLIQAIKQKTTPEVQENDEIRLKLKKYSQGKIEDMEPIEFKKFLELDSVKTAGKVDWIRKKIMSNLPGMTMAATSLMYIKLTGGSSEDLLQEGLLQTGSMIFSGVASSLGVPSTFAMPFMLLGSMTFCRWSYPKAFTALKDWGYIKDASFTNPEDWIDSFKGIFGKLFRNATNSSIPTQTGATEIFSFGLFKQGFTQLGWLVGG